MDFAAIHRITSAAEAQWHQRDETQAHHRRPVAHQLRVLLEAGLVQEVRGLMDHRVDDHLGTWDPQWLVSGCCPNQGKGRQI